MERVETVDERVIPYTGFYHSYRVLDTVILILLNVYGVAEIFHRVNIAWRRNDIVIYFLLACSDTYPKHNQICMYGLHITVIYYGQKSGHRSRAAPHTAQRTAQDRTYWATATRRSSCFHCQYFCLGNCARFVFLFQPIGSCRWKSNVYSR